MSREVVAVTKTDQAIAPLSCWRCQSAHAGALFCAQCKALQPFSRDQNYFAYFGLSDRLNIDLYFLEARYYDLSRQFHPDFYQRKSPGERDISLENSARLNLAYKTLKDPIQRMEYLLISLGQSPQPSAPEDLFDEIFEVQETMAELSAVPPEKSEQRALLCHALQVKGEVFKQRRAQEMSHLFILCDEWDALLDDMGLSSAGGGLSERQEAICRKMQALLSHQRYLDRVLGEASVAMGTG